MKPKPTFEQATAVRMFEGILRFARTGSGDQPSDSGSEITVLCSLSKTTPCASSASATAPKPTAEK
jgi:hypothetical protein